MMGVYATHRSTILGFPLVGKGLINDAITVVQLYSQTSLNYIPNGQSTLGKLKAAIPRRVRLHYPQKG